MPWPDPDGLAFARLLRQHPRFHLLPIVALTAPPSVADHVDAIRAGVDEILPLPTAAELVRQVLIARAERWRRVREMVHRDGLTGLLNQATLMAELEQTVEYARRSGESFALLVYDIDHFRRINDRHGYLLGDEVLLHLAGILRSSLRASDFVGRYGGETFALILRNNAQPGAEIVAAKLRRAVSQSPAETRDGPVPITMSGGCACYLTDGVTAAEMAHAADRALLRAKGAGRDRVEFGG